MKVTHICLNGPVTDNWSYQDNLLPKYHKVIGFEVSVIASKYVWNDKGKIDIDNRTMYYNEYGIKTIRIESKYNTTVNSKFKKYKNLYTTICNEKPDIIFVHGCQFFDIKYVVKYAKLNSDVKVFVDNHADFSNSATNFLSKNVLHKIFWKRCAHKIEPYTNKFYGVLPARVDFLKNIYKLSEEKIELLVMGADDELVELSSTINNKKAIREKYNIKEDDFLVMTGGKIDGYKAQTLLLMEAINRIDNPKLKLIVFGSIAEELKVKVNELVDDERVQYIGWIDSRDTYSYFASSDLVIFPGRHSVFWEQVAGQGIPMICKEWQGTKHVDLGGNVEFLKEDSVGEISRKILKVMNIDKYQSMKKVATIEGMKYFSYKKIAIHSIN
jgi:hypothetical protein